MAKNIIKVAMAAATFAALPGVAQAGTSTATANVTMQVGTQCVVSGANVHLGSFKSTETWGAVGAKHGSYVFNVYTAGTAGKESLYFGSVTCDLNLPWTLTIKGTATGTGSVGGVKLTLNGNTAVLYPAIKRIGSVTLGDSMPGYFPTTGYQVWQNAAPGTGTGAKQDLYGNITLTYSALETTVSSTTTMGVPNTATGSLTYTLTF